MSLFLAFFGIILLETINYVEHYGLVRKLKDNGRYEAISKFHSWNSNYPLGRLFFFQLTLHSRFFYTLSCHLLDDIKFEQVNTNESWASTFKYLKIASSTRRI